MKLRKLSKVWFSGEGWTPDRIIMLVLSILIIAIFIPYAALFIMNPEQATGVVPVYHDRFNYSLLTKVPVVQNTWYTVLNTTADFSLFQFGIYQYCEPQDGGAQTVEVRWTVDGKVYSGAQSILLTTPYIGYLYVDDDNSNSPGVPHIELLTYELGFASPFQQVYDYRGQSIKIEVRITSVPETASEITAWAYYATYVTT